MGSGQEKVGVGDSSRLMGKEGGVQGDASHKRSESNPTRLKGRQMECNRVHGHASGAQSGVSIDG
jgi:hypothetical protein